MRTQYGTEKMVIIHSAQAYVLMFVLMSLWKPGLNGRANCEQPNGETQDRTIQSCGRGMGKSTGNEKKSGRNNEVVKSLLKFLPYLRFQITEQTRCFLVRFISNFSRFDWHMTSVISPSQTKTYFQLHRLAVKIFIYVRPNFHATFKTKTGSNNETCTKLET